MEKSVLLTQMSTSTWKEPGALPIQWTSEGIQLQLTMTCGVCFVFRVIFQVFSHILRVAEQVPCPGTLDIALSPSAQQELLPHAPTVSLLALVFNRDASLVAQLLKPAGVPLLKQRNMTLAWNAIVPTQQRFRPASPVRFFVIGCTFFPKMDLSSPITVCFSFVVTRFDVTILCKDPIPTNIWRHY